MTGTTLSPDEIGYVRKLVLDLAGNVLEQGKGYLVEARLQPVARRLGLASVRRLLLELRGAAPDQRHLDTVEAMTTKETMFFRDGHLFDALRDVVLPTLGQAGRHVSAWCIGCSTGQEPYSLAMLAESCRPQVRLTLIASDISREALDLATTGSYSEFEVNRGLSDDFRQRFFVAAGDRWQVKEGLRRSVTWRRINVVEPFPSLPPMDLILFRNVMIYFDTDLRRRALQQVRSLLRPGGYLFVGAPENLMAHTDLFESVHLGATLGYRPIPVS